MPVSNEIKLLEETLQQTQEASEHLAISASRCNKFSGSPTFTEEQLIELDALTSRFARLSDLLIQKFYS